MLRTFFIAGALGILSMAAQAATLTTSFSAWQAGIGGATVTRTPTSGLFDPTALDLPTTGIIPLADGQKLGLSIVVQVQQPDNGGFPYALADGFAGDLFMPQDSSGNAVQKETITVPSAIKALGFELVPFSSKLSGPYSISVTLADGQTASASLPGGDFNSGSTQAQFFGFYGGPVSSLILATSDPNGFAFGNFVDVPEPASLLLFSCGMASLIAVRRGM